MRIPAGLQKRWYVVAFLLNHFHSLGRRYRDGLREAAVPVAIWSRTDEEFGREISALFDRFLIPVGISMPWGTVVKP